MESMSMTFFLLRDFSFICFAYFYYLVIHSILFHYIHAFLWILCTPLIIFMFLGWSFLVSCTLFQSWQKGGEIVIWFLFLRFYMLWGELCSFVRGVVLYLVRSCAYLLLSVHWSFDHVYIHCAYLWYIYIYDDVYLLHLSLHVLFLFFLYTHVSYYLYTIYYFCFTQICLDEFCLNCFRNTGCQSLLAINSLLAKFFKSLC